MDGNTQVTNEQVDLNAKAAHGLVDDNETEPLKNIDETDSLNRESNGDLNDAKLITDETDSLNREINGDLNGYTKTVEAVDDDHSATADNRKVPIDRGWAWVVLVACTFEMFIIIGVMRCYGIFFLHFQEKFKSTSSVTSLIATLQNAFYSVSGLFVMTVGLRFISCRKSVVVGGLLTGVAYVLTTVLEDIRAVLFVNGAFVGVSLSFVYAPSMTMLSTYFEKRRGLANSISNAGVSLGGLTLVPLFTYLFEEYGYRGTFLLAAGIYFNVIVFGLLLRPIEFYTTRNAKPQPINGTETTKELKEKKFKEQNYDDIKDHKIWKIETDKVDDMETVHPYVESETYAFLEKGETTDSALVERHNRLNIGSQHSSKSFSSAETFSSLFEGNVMIHAGTDYMHSSLQNVYNSTHDISNEYPNETLSSEHKLQPSGALQNIKKYVQIIFDFSILKDPLFLYYLLCTFFLCSGNATTPFYVAPYANNIGISADRTAIVLIVINVVELLARVFFGFISDKKWIKTSNLIALTSAILGVANCLVYFVNGFVSLMIFAVVLGILMGVYWSLFIVVIVDYLTLEKLKSALGFCCLVQGLSVGCAMPVAGFLKDTTGTYVTSYIFIGALLLIGSALATLLPVVQRWRTRRNRKLSSN